MLTARHLVGLGKPPLSPFNNVKTEVVKHDGNGVVDLQLLQDELYVGDLGKAFLYFSQKSGEFISVHDLLRELEDRHHILLNSNILDDLYENPDLFPNHWKRDNTGNTIYICFFGTIFSPVPSKDLYVRTLFWRGGGLQKDRLWLNYGLPSKTLAAVVI